MTVGSDHLVGRASIKVAEPAFHIQLGFIVAFSRSNSSVRFHETALVETSKHRHPFRCKL